MRILGFRLLIEAILFTSIALKKRLRLSDRPRQAKRRRCIAGAMLSQQSRRVLSYCREATEYLHRPSRQSTMVLLYDKSVARADYRFRAEYSLLFATSKLE